jgi:ABC-type arginine transport system ATPase subunit
MDLVLQSDLVTALLQEMASHPDMELDQNPVKVSGPRSDQDLCPAMAMGLTQEMVMELDQQSDRYPVKVSGPRSDQGLCPAMAMGQQ